MNLFILILLAGQHIVATQNRIKIKQSPMSLIYSAVPLFDKTRCNWMKYMKHQYKLCKKDPNVSDVLLKTRDLTVTHCENQFRYERWNCSRKNFVFKRVHRETALLYAMGASAITYSIARACSEGVLENCHCGRESGSNKEIEKWRWGGCNDNLEYGKKFTKRFLRLRQKGDYPYDILRHNSEVGIETVSENFIKVCRCQGVSGSCTIKICWKRIRSFKKIAEKLSNRYYSALKLNPGNKISNRELKKRETKMNLVYLAKSSTFCDTTAGRQCLDSSNCATLCCTRGYDTKSVIYSKNCNCRWQNSCCFEMKCDTCNYTRDEYFCKP